MSTSEHSNGHEAPNSVEGRVLETRSRPAGRSGRATSDFTELAHVIRSRGLLRRRYGYYWAKLVAAPLVLIACLVAFVWIGDTWWQLFTAAVLAIVFTWLRAHQGLLFFPILLLDGLSLHASSSRAREAPPTADPARAIADTRSMSCSARARSRIEIDSLPSCARRHG